MLFEWLHLLFFSFPSSLFLPLKELNVTFSYCYWAIPFIYIPPPPCNFLLSRSTNQYRNEISKSPPISRDRPCVEPLCIKVSITSIHFLVLKSAPIDESDEVLSSQFCLFSVFWARHTYTLHFNPLAQNPVTTHPALCWVFWALPQSANILPLSAQRQYCELSNIQHTSVSSDQLQT